MLFRSAPASVDALKIPTGSAANIVFNITGAEGREVLVGLMQTVSGATLEQFGTTVTFKWAVPAAGNHPIQFLLRDKQKCVDAESDASRCTINPSDYGQLGTKAYDVASDTYTLVVGGAGQDQFPLPGGNTGSGGLGGGNNAQLIQTIIGLLGGQGGGNLQGVLSGLTNGQLNQLLGKLQNGQGGNGGLGAGGGGLDINQLLDLIK